MSFVSASFAALYVVALAVRWGARWKHGPPIIVLLALSWLFYAWHVPQYIFLILFSTIVDYVAGRRLSALAPGFGGQLKDEQHRHLARRRKMVVAVSLLLNLGMLGWFKYAGFLVLSLNQTGLTGVSVPDIVLPIGISFYTFQSLSYTIDVYRGQIPAERNFLRLACYIAFFPQLVAGPIVRAGSFLYQFDRKRRFHFSVFLEGGYLIVRGLFLKLVIADNLGRIVDTHWTGAAAAPDGILAYSMLVFFACQLFCDFAGYSDMARGFAYQLGFRLPVNFNAPYIAATFSGFWRRWHISLSQWMRDYVYVTLGGNRSSRFRMVGNILIVMLLSGLWHGANWTFVLWGGALGAALIVEKALRFDGLQRLAAILIWYLVVQTAWVLSLGLFRAESLSEGFAVIAAALTLVPDLIQHGFDRHMADGLVVLGWCLTVPVWLLHARALLSERTAVACPGRYEKSFYAGVMLACVMTMYSSAQTFIYFQF